MADALVAQREAEDLLVLQKLRHLGDRFVPPILVVIFQIAATRHVVATPVVVTIGEGSEGRVEEARMFGAILVDLVVMRYRVHHDTRVVRPGPLKRGATTVTPGLGTPPSEPQLVRDRGQIVRRQAQ